MRISVIVPVLDEEPEIEACLHALAPVRAAGHEVVVVDGGSADATVALAAPLSDRLLQTGRGRARQLNAGAAAAAGEAFIFLHADTRLPDGAVHDVATAIAGGRRWGRFDVSLSGRQPLLRLVEGAMNLRSRLTGIATGDQAMFVDRELFRSIGGFPDLALMEDVALSARLRTRMRPACLPARVLVSSRRWQRHGVLRTIVKMWCLRAAYALGVDPRALARRYDD